MKSLKALVDRIAEDPDFLLRLIEDPQGTAKAEGLQIPEDELRQALKIGADEDLAEALKERLAHCYCGGGGCGVINFPGL
jgi:hypothetical protein